MVVYKRGNGSVPRSVIDEFYVNCGLDPASVVAVEIYRDHMIVEKILFRADGEMRMDHMGPCTRSHRVTIEADADDPLFQTPVLREIAQDRLAAAAREEDE